MALELVNTHSRYESLLKGEFGGTDVSLIFVEDGPASAESSASAAKSTKTDDSDDQPTHQRREIRAHRAFLRCCGLIRAALDEEHGYAEANRNEVRVVVPPGTFGAVDGLLRWCYDGKCQFEAVQRKTDYLLLESRVEGVAALWSLADFVQCLELCKAIEAMLRGGKLRSGSSFAALVNEASSLGTPSVIDAALVGLPLEREQREELELWLDFGGNKMLNAMAKWYKYKLDAFETESESEDEEDSDSDEDNLPHVCELIVETLGEFLPEMTRENRAEMMPSVFGECLAFMPAGIISEADYANMVMDYIDDAREEMAELSAVALLSSIDFTAVSRETLERKLIPRVECLASSHNALTLCDIAPAANTVTSRCAFAGHVLHWDDEFCVLPCGNVVCYEAALRLFPKHLCDTDQSGRVKSEAYSTVFCPICYNHKFDRHKIIAADVGYLRLTKRTFAIRTSGSRWTSDVIQARAIRFAKHASIDRFKAYLERKRIKCDVLRDWAYSIRENEENAQVLPRPIKKSRASLLLQNKAPFVKFLNQCSTIGSESVQWYAVRSADSAIKETLDLFAERNNFLSSQQICFTTNGEELVPENKWKDLNFLLAGAENEVIVARRAQIGGKPVIRFYSNDIVDSLDVSLEFVDWKNIISYPRASLYVNSCNPTISWNVKLVPQKPSAEIEHKSCDGIYRKYSYLFWEASTLNGFNICLSEASCVRSNELNDGILQDALIAQGLSIEEATEMATHWLPLMTQKEFVMIQFLPQHYLDQRAKLTVSPAPDIVHRVFMLFHSTDSRKPCEVPLVRSPPIVVDREKFAVVEWGGMECY